jgi:threonine/homoserine/homoserine lactone efflux protein
VLLGAMSPGPDFIVVTKNTLKGSRRLGIFTGLGVACALLVHILYASLGLAVIIHSSKIWYFIFKFTGSTYLAYLGVRLILEKKFPLEHKQETKRGLTDKTAFMSGFLCNLLNIKASLFIVGLFTQIVAPNISILNLAVIAFEITSITFLWFALLSVILTHEKINHLYMRIQRHINISMGVLLIGFSFKMVFS